MSEASSAPAAASIRGSGLLLAWYSLLALFTLVIVSGGLPLPTERFAISELRFSQSEAGTRDQPISLPDNWRSFSERTDHPGVYSGTFDVSAGADDWSVYIPRHLGIIALRVNGVTLATSDFCSSQIADQSAPFLVGLPPELLKSGPNALTITLVPGGLLEGFLDTPFVGPDEHLRARHRC